MKNKIIEELIFYAKENLFLDELDTMFIRNSLLYELDEEKPYEGEIDEELIKSYETPKPILDELISIDPSISEFKIEKIMSILTPKPSEVIGNFNELLKTSSKDSCEYFYNLMIKNNYIKLDNIRKNVKWEYEGYKKNLEITINLSKPEKSNKDIAKAQKEVSSSYPKCLLCYSNEGFYGNSVTPARSNIRVIPLKLGNEEWFMQYSPYCYYDEHAIIINKEHKGMHITKDTIEKELEFIDLIPNYFVGCNADLPIVGGSMLSHEHFQGGKHLMPMMFSRTRYILKRRDVRDVEISYLDWYNSCILLKGKNKKSLLDLSDLIIREFESYNDESIDLIAEDDNGRHSTITSIARKESGVYYIYLILRNNRCNEKYKEGIFHAHEEYHNIKKEGIGLIEAMGLFILPGRLDKELSSISYLMSHPYASISEEIKNKPELSKHLSFINFLASKYGRRNTEDAAYEIVKLEVSRICENILRNTAIFKDTIDGQLALFRFFKRLLFEVTE